MNFFTSWVRKNWEENKKERRELILRLSRQSVLDKSNVKYLDLGCDDGSFTKRVAEEIGSKEVYGVDLNSIRLEKAKERGIKTFKSDLNKMFPFKDNAFDLITCDQVIEHLWNIDLFCSEIKRVLKPNAIVIVCTENLAALYNIYALVRGGQPYTGPNISTKYQIGSHPLLVNKLFYEAKVEDHKRVFAFNSLKELFEKYNFEVNKVYPIGYLPFGKFLKKLFLLLDKKHCHFILIKAKNLK